MSNVFETTTSAIYHMLMDFMEKHDNISLGGGYKPGYTDDMGIHELDESYVKCHRDVFRVYADELLENLNKLDIDEDKISFVDFSVNIASHGTIVLYRHGEDPYRIRFGLNFTGRKWPAAEQLKDHWFSPYSEVEDGAREAINRYTGERLPVTEVIEKYKGETTKVSLAGKEATELFIGPITEDTIQQV